MDDAAPSPNQKPGQKSGRLPFVARAEYGVRQAARVAWFMGQSYAMHRAPAVKGTLGDRKPTSLPLPSRDRIMKDLRALFAVELD
ncbi:MAG: hypothetical protein K8F31_05085, partial [Roseovarius sp.]|nr:hypothetical protein [Roseovarius sp.]